MTALAAPAFAELVRDTAPERCELRERRLRARPLAAHTFRAWFISDDGQKRTAGNGKRLVSSPGCAYAYPVPIDGAASLRAARDAAAPRCQHKGKLWIESTNVLTGFARLHIYAIKRDSTPRYGGYQGLDRTHDLYAEHFMDVDLNGPLLLREPEDAIADPVGVFRGATAS